MMDERFSRRHGFQGVEPEITVRQDAPRDLRSALVYIAYESRFKPMRLRRLVCRILRVAEDPDNNSDSYIDREVRRVLMECPWYEVYDVIEEIQRELADSETDQFNDEINRYFRREGIGWQLSDSQIEVRGPETFEVAVRGALDTLQEGEHLTAHNELREALGDLSRRPEPDITGAIQHAMAALECVAREVTGDTRATLGKILGDNPDLLPRPLDQALEKVWGYASEKARHVREGELPEYEEAELLLSITGGVSGYLIKKWKQRQA